MKTPPFRNDEELKAYIRDRVTDDEAGKVLVMDGFAPAAIGLHFDNDRYRVVYSYQRIIETLVTEHGLDHEDAIDHYDYNIERSLPYAGAEAPIVIEEFTP